MREIKFRAWDKQYNFMISAEDIHPRVMNELITGEGKVLEIDERHSYVGTDISYIDISDNRILMQYTGLKDKNGKEIYEGDILEEWIYPQTVRDNGKGVRTFTTHIHDKKISNKSVVKFNEEKGCFDAKEIKGYWYRALDDIEVIGNIYENPELLEV